MKKARYELENEIETLAQRTDGKKQRKIINQLFAEHNIPVSVSSDMLSLKRSPSTETEFVLYHLLKKLNEKEINKYFTDKEIKEYEGIIVESEKVKFPLRFNVVQIADDQWIGKITMKELMDLGSSQLINYNENAQRVLKRIIRGGEEYYRIQLNKAAVEAIKESLLLDRYIPNTITLNIPQDDDNRFSYDESAQEMIIKSLHMFDILDGYHRYIAMSNIFVQRPDFDLTIELRLTNFSDEKARQFIWQEDQKTKMKRVDSNALNKYNNGNKVVAKLKDKGFSDIIGRNSIIDEAELSQGINTILLRQRKYTNSELNILTQIIKEGFAAVEEKDPQIFDKPLDVLELYCMLVAFGCEEKDIDVIRNFEKDIVEVKEISIKRDLQPSEARKLKVIFKERRNSYV